MRIGKLKQEPVDLKAGSTFVLTGGDITGDETRVSTTFPRLPLAVKPGDALFLNDGLIQLEVSRIARNDVHCRVIVGGELRSRKGLNLPGIDLGINVFTDHDYDCLKFSLENGVDAVSQSFVEKAEDIRAVREAAALPRLQSSHHRQSGTLASAGFDRGDRRNGRRHYDRARRPGRRDAH